MPVNGWLSSCASEAVSSPMLRCLLTSRELRAAVLGFQLGVDLFFLITLPDEDAGEGFSEELQTVLVVGLERARVIADQRERADGVLANPKRRHRQRVGHSIVRAVFERVEHGRKLPFVAGLRRRRRLACPGVKHGELALAGSDLQQTHFISSEEFTALRQPFLEVRMLVGQPPDELPRQV